MRPEGKCRLCRQEGELFLKGTAASEKCLPIERRGYAPGEHGKDRRPKETNLRPAARMSRRPGASTAFWSVGSELLREGGAPGRHG